MVGGLSVTLDPHPETSPVRINPMSAVRWLVFKYTHPAETIGPAIPILERPRVVEFRPLTPIRVPMHCSVAGRENQCARWLHEVAAARYKGIPFSR